MMNNLMKKAVKVMTNPKGLKVLGIGTAVSAVAGAVIGFIDEKKKETTVGESIIGEETIEEDDIIINDDFQE